MQTALQWLYDNLYNYMIPICGLCVLRIVMCLAELSHMKRLRDKKFVFRHVTSHYREIGTFAGLLIGSVLVCVFPKLALLFAAVAIALGVVGYRIGKNKGDEADRVWQEVVNELAASDEAHKVNAISVESNFGGLIDTIDVFGNDEEPQQLEAPAEATANTEATEDIEPPQ